MRKGFGTGDKWDQTQLTICLDELKFHNAARMPIVESAMNKRKSQNPGHGWIKYV